MKKTKSSIKLLLGIAIILSLLFFLVSYVYSNNENMFFCGLVLLILEEIIIGLYFQDNIAYALFLFSCFLFMQGRYLVNIIVEKEMDATFDPEILTHVNLCIFLTLICLLVGFKLSSKVSICIGKKNKVYSINYIRSIQNVSVKMFYLSSIFAILSQIDIILFIKNNSYIDYYVNYSSHLPRILQVLGNMYLAFFWIYMCTIPPKKNCKNKIILYIIITFFIICSGDRGGFVQNMGILLVYVFWRQRRDQEIWIKKKFIIIGLCTLPFFMAFMSYFVYLREGIDVGTVSFVAQLQRFVSITGRSSNVIAYGKLYEDRFPLHFYSLGGVIDYIKYNPVSEVLFGIVKPKAQTADYAMIMHSFESALSYFVYPQSYYNGHGVGSSYLAETYFDFGYIGIILISIIYGMILGKCKKLNDKNPFRMALVLLIVRGLFYAPRGPALIFIMNIINITTVTAFLFIYVMSSLIRSKSQ